MNFSQEDFVTVGDILADVLKVVKDSDYKTNSRGWYVSQIQQSLEDLSFDTFFFQINKTLPIPENLSVPMPKGTFNIRQIYAHNGDQCDFGSAVNVYHKRNMINSPSGRDYLARDRWGNHRDPFHLNRSRVHENPNGVYFFGIQNGIIMLSSSCKVFDHITVVYNGVHTDIGEVPVVPTFLRQAVKLRVTVEALKVKLVDAIGTPEYTQWNNVLQLHKNDLEDPYDGEWIKAERRAKTLDAKQREDIKMYFQRMNY